MRWLIKGKYFIPILLFAGVAQYALVALNLILFGEVPLWTLESDLLEDSGPLRYIKDVVIIVVAFVWVIFISSIKLSPEIKHLIKTYFYWLGAIFVIGTIAFVLDYSPLLFLPSGIRWLLLLHSAFGVFLISSSIVVDQKSHQYIFGFITILLALDAYAVILQFSATSNIYNLAFGAARLTGLFSNAGIAAFFSIAAALICGQLDGIKLRTRMAVTSLCVVLALSSGTRFATMSVFIYLLLQFMEIARSAKRVVRVPLQIIMVPAFIFLTLFAYESLVTQVDRGSAIIDQFSSGGRVSNFFEAFDMLADGELGELLIGRGLGVGTNTAYSVLLSEGVIPESYRFNILVDNSLLTCFFQIGLLGSLVFWYGLLKFINMTRPRYSANAKLRYIGVIVILTLTIVLGNPFEHYFLMMSYAISLGCIYWSDQVRGT